MKQFLRIRSLWTFSWRFESKTSDPKRVAEALRRFNRENKKQFGELIKKAKPKSAAETDKHVVSCVHEGNQSAIDAAPKTSMLASVSNIVLSSDPTSKRKKAKTSVASHKGDSTCKKKKPSKQKLDNRMTEFCEGQFSSKSKRKSSKQSLDSKIAESSYENEPLKKKTRKAAVAAKSGSLPSNEFNREENAKIVQTVEGEQVENPKIGTDNPQINTQSSEVSFSETNKKYDAGATYTDHLDDENEVTTTAVVSNPYSEYTLLNKFKKIYSPDCKYSEIKAIDPNYYPYPSVTYILSESMSPSSEMNLKRWKENLISELGDDEFQVYSRSLMHSAKSLRKLILLRLRGYPDSKLDIPQELQGCWESLKFVFPLFPKVKEIGKVAVHSELKYKGMVDSLIEFRNKLVLVSWKKANKYVPSLDKTYDLPIQCAAYIGAINSDPSFHFLVDEALLVMSYTNGMTADIFHIKSDQCQIYWKLWLDRLHTYHLRAKKTEVKDISKSDFGKLNIEEELAKMKERNANISELDSESSQIILSNTEESINSTLVASNNFPLVNEEKMTYTDQKFELGTADQTVFKSFPAVTTILNETKSAASKFILERWKNNLIAELGIEGFENYQRNLLSTGISFHKLIQNHLQGNFQEIPAELQGCWDSLQPVFHLIGDVKLSESKVVHEKLQYKGVIDCVAKFRDKLVVIDWKKSDKLKSTISMTYDAPLQVAAYIGAINYDRNYPFRVEEGLLVISYTDGSKADVYHLNTENCQKYWEQWLQRLRNYQLVANSDWFSAPKYIPYYFYMSNSVSRNVVVEGQKIKY